MTKKEVDLRQFIKADTDPATLKLIEEAMKKKGVTFDVAVASHQRTLSGENRFVLLTHSHQTASFRDL
jgi:hypothetical protein